MNDKKIPGFMLALLRWFCPDHLLEEIEGDLTERFEKDIRLLGPKKARRKFIWNALRFFRPGIILRYRSSPRPFATPMFANYFKVASRNIVKRKLFSFINAVGLSTGIAFCILIYLFIRDERSFDQFHAGKDRILRMHGLILTVVSWAIRRRRQARNCTTFSYCGTDNLLQSPSLPS